MEDLEQRRQRLAAMREQASTQATSGGAEDGSGAGFLPRPDFVIDSAHPPLPSNPLETLPGAGRTSPHAASIRAPTGSRFGFYTDPLAGFSGSKRKKPYAAVGVMNSATTPDEIAMPSNHLDRYPAGPPPIIPHVQGDPGFNPAGPPPWEPVPYQAPSYPVLPPQAPWFPQSQWHPPPMPPQSVDYAPGQVFGRGRGAGGRGYYSGPPMGRGAPPLGRAGGGYSASNVGLEGRSFGRGSSAGGSGSSSSFTRSRVGGHDRSAGGGRGGGGGVVSAKEHPHLFYKESMVEDPWAQLEASRLGKT